MLWGKGGLAGQCRGEGVVMWFFLCESCGVWYAFSEGIVVPMLRGLEGVSRGVCFGVSFPFLCYCWVFLRR